MKPYNCVQILYISQESLMNRIINLKEQYLTILSDSDC